MNDLDERLNSAGTALLHACVALPDAPAPLRRRHGHRRIGLGVGAIGVASMLIAVNAVNRHDGERQSAGPSSATVTVDYEKATLTLDTQLTCQRPIEPEFKSAIYESWSDRTNKRWRTTITYPDGSTFDVTLSGSAIYPNASWSRGTVREVSAGCAFDSGEIVKLGSIPGGWFESLNLGQELAPDEMQFYGGTFDQSGSTRVGPADDSQSRATTLWRRTIGDGASMTVDGKEMAVNQDTEWYVTDDDKVIEYRFVNRTEGLGTVTSMTSIAEYQTIDVSGSIFDVAGWSPMPGSPRPHRDCPSADPLTTGPLTISFTGDDECLWAARGTLTVTNSGEASCSSDVVGSVSNGLGIVFRSSSGYGGATGDWAIAPPDYMPTGIIEYPTGERSWPMSVDGLGSGDAVLTLPSITCGEETFEVELRIAVPQ